MANIQKVTEPDDPRRCQQLIDGKGQCPLVSMDGTNKCIAHGGQSIVKKQAAEGLKNYRLAMLQEEINEQAESGQVKSLRAEVVLLKSLMQKQLSSIKTEVDLLAKSPVIFDMVDKIQRVVKSCSQIENSMGTMLDKVRIVNLAMEMVNIVSKYVDDPEVLENIANDLSTVLGAGDQ